jgi:hypothetical protein
LFCFQQFEYRICHGLNDSWGEWVSGTSYPTITEIAVSSGDKIQFRGDNKTYTSQYLHYNSFSSSTGTRFTVEGNIMSLINSTDYFSSLNLASGRTFQNLFMTAGLTSAENLILPARTLNDYCYACMFSGCTNLVNAPELPATTLASNCYAGMFSGCTSLT